MLYFCGFNGFHQFGKKHARKVVQPEELLLSELLEGEFTNCNSKKVVIASSWSYNVFALDNIIALIGFVNKKPNFVRKTRTVSGVKKIVQAENICYVLLDNGELYKLNVNTFSMEKIILQTDGKKALLDGRKRNIFGNIKEDPCYNEIEHIACGSHITVAITRGNCVYNPSAKLHQFENHIRIIHVECGFEHAVALSSNGDVYTWGTGLRGQLGEDSMRNCKIPTIVEALAGIRIVSVSAGGWHNAAITTFGDVYCWGFNETGQLGMRVFHADGINKHPLVHPIPDVIDLPLCCDKHERQNAAETVPIQVKTEVGEELEDITRYRVHYRGNTIDLEAGDRYIFGINDEETPSEATGRQSLRIERINDREVLPDIIIPAPNTIQGYTGVPPISIGGRPITMGGLNRPPPTVGGFYRPPSTMGGYYMPPPTMGWFNRPPSSMGGCSTHPPRMGGCATHPPRMGGCATHPPSMGGGSTLPPSMGGCSTHPPNIRGCSTHPPNIRGCSTHPPSMGACTTHPPSMGGCTRPTTSTGGGYRPPPTMGGSNSLPSTKGGCMPMAGCCIPRRAFIPSQLTRYDRMPPCQINQMMQLQQRLMQAGHIFHNPNLELMYRIYSLIARTQNAPENLPPNGGNERNQNASTENRTDNNDGIVAPNGDNEMSPEILPQSAQTNELGDEDMVSEQCSDLEQRRNAADNQTESDISNTEHDISEEQKSEKIEDQKSEKIEEQKIEKIEEQKNEKIEEQTNEKIEEQKTEKIEEQTNEKIEEQTNEKIEEQKTEKIEEQTNEKIEEQTNEKFEEQTNEKIEEQKTEQIEEQTNENIEEPNTISSSTEEVTVKEKSQRTETRVKDSADMDRKDIEQSATSSTELTLLAKEDTADVTEQDEDMKPTSIVTDTININENSTDQDVDMESTSVVTDVITSNTNSAEQDIDMESTSIVVDVNKSNLNSSEQDVDMESTSEVTEVNSNVNSIEQDVDMKPTKYTNKDEEEHLNNTEKLDTTELSDTINATSLDTDKDIISNQDTDVGTSKGNVNANQDTDAGASSSESNSVDLNIIQWNDDRDLTELSETVITTSDDNVELSDINPDTERNATSENTTVTLPTQSNAVRSDTIITIPTSPNSVRVGNTITLPACLHSVRPDTTITLPTGPNSARAHNTTTLPTCSHSVRVDNTATTALPTDSDLQSVGLQIAIKVEKDRVATDIVAGPSTSAQTSAQTAPVTKVEEIPDNCKAVKAFCGGRHTIIQMECGQLFATGFNENGQIGVPQDGQFIDQFTKISVPSTNPKQVEVFCGPWCTIFRV